jgi:retron-type reverse transcriptase
VQFDVALPTFEDKVAQRAIVMVLELVYEQDFLSCSFGFRPGRSAHGALQELRTGFTSQGLRWVIDLDIVKFSTRYRTHTFAPFSTDESRMASSGG